MNLVCVCINHKTASVEEREKIFMQPDEVRAALNRLRPDVLRECMIVSTCNRTELFGVPVSEDVSTDFLKDFIISFKDSHGVVGKEKFFSLVACGAIKHFFDVASGIDSLIVGDMQILGQVREAYALAAESGAAGPVINRLSHTSFAVGKRVRSETQLMMGAVSVSYAAVELASKIFDDLEAKKIILLGAGDTAELTLKILAERGATNVTIANRTRANAEELSKKVGVGKVVDFGSFGETLQYADMVITSVMVHQPLIHKETVADAMRARTKRTPLFIVDIGVPRNVDPIVKELNNVFLHDIDSLSVIVEQNMMRRRGEIPKAEAIIDEEANAMFAWLNTQEAVPAIKALRELFERIRAAELEKFRHRFSDEQFALLEQMTHRMMQRLLHAPTVNLKQLVIDSNAPLTHEELIRYLFNLDSLTAGWAESDAESNDTDDTLNNESKSE